MVLLEETPNHYFVIAKRIPNSGTRGRISRISAIADLKGLLKTYRYGVLMAMAAKLDLPLGKESTKRE